MRVSVMLHLPALVITRQIEKVFRSLQKISLAVRGLYGEGSQAMGDFYQISNQITLGRSEDGTDQAGRRHRAGDHRLRAAGPRVPHQGKPREPARPREPGLRHPPHGADDQLRRDHAPALQRADGREPGPDPRPGDPDGQRAVHPHAAGPSAKAHRRRAGHAPTATSNAPATSAATSTKKTATAGQGRTSPRFSPRRMEHCSVPEKTEQCSNPTARRTLRGGRTLVGYAALCCLRCNVRGSTITAVGVWDFSPPKQVDILYLDLAHGPHPLAPLALPAVDLARRRLGRTAVRLRLGGHRRGQAVLRKALRPAERLRSAGGPTVARWWAVCSGR